MSRKLLIIETSAVVVSIVLLILGFVFQQGAPEPWYVVMFFGLSFFIGGFAKAKEGVLATIENKALNVEILMILAALGAFIVGDYSEGAILILIFSISGVLESYTTSKSEKELTHLLKLAPKTALKLDGENEVEVAVSDLKVGDQVIVKVGQQIPVDGIIIKGSTSLDQAAITGEFVPVYKSVNEDVFAGSINNESTIIVETKKDPSQSVVQKIVDFVKEAQEHKTPAQSFIDRFEKYYVYIVITLSILFMTVPPLFNWWTPAYAFNRGIIVLVVGSPCALVASISPAMLSALSNGARHRILIKGGSPLEQMIGIQTVVMDKTGTITTGTPKVVRIEVIEELDKDYVISLLHTMEKQSRHPLAQAVSRHLNDTPVLENIQTQEKSGHGMEADVDGTIWRIGRFDADIHPSLLEKLDRCNALGHSNINIIKDNQVVGFVALMDTIRDNAKDVVQELKAMGINTVLLTGDHRFTAQAIAKETGIDHFEHNLMPEDKVSFIEHYQKTKGKIMMVGDGINDAPALALADLSIAMGTGTDISLETSDVVIMNDQLENIPRLFKLANRTRRVTLQNIIFSTSVILFLMISNVLGLIELPTGVVAHETSTILVILNSLRLLIK